MNKRIKNILKIALDKPDAKLRIISNKLNLFIFVFLLA